MEMRKKNCDVKKFSKVYSVQKTEEKKNKINFYKFI